MHAVNLNDTPLPNIVRGKSGGILVITALGSVIKESTKSDYAASAKFVLPVNGLRSDINEPGHEARYAYPPISFAVKTKTSPWS
jgi:short-subunit dehydrogenase